MLNLTSTFSSRRSHLDSATYRTLVRIFSLCLDGDESLNPSQQQNSNPSPSPCLGSDSNGNSKSAAFAEDSLRPPAAASNSPLAAETGNPKGNEEKDCAKLIGGSVDDANLLSNNQKGSSDELKREDSGENAREVVEGTKQDAGTDSSSVSEDSGDINLEDGDVDGDDFEEGEIPNDVDNLNQPVDLVHECKDNKLEELSAYEGLNKNGNSILADDRKNKIYLKNGSSNISQGTTNFATDGYLQPEKKNSIGDVVVADAEWKHTDNRTDGTNKEKGKQPAPEVVQVQVMKKRAPLTKERRAKKKIAKKRKRAQKDREQGIKRLKLQPVVKPKEVKYCNFYMVGKCQQGASCKYSHDTTPLTKSQPCKYFACDSCLRGDDCQFDHQLSKYPCHNWESTGMCIRGDRCKFSHKLLIPGNSSPASASKKADVVLSSGKSNSVKQPYANRISPGTSDQHNVTVVHRTMLGVTDGCKSAAASTSHPTMIHPAGGKAPAQIPNGIRFLSFGKQKAEQQDKEKSLSLVPQKSLPVAQSEKKNETSGVSVNSVARTTNDCKKSNDGGLQAEITEASKLLQEFLFCGIN